MLYEFTHLEVYKSKENEVFVFFSWFHVIKVVNFRVDAWTNFSIRIKYVLVSTDRTFSFFVYRPVSERQIDVKIEYCQPNYIGRSLESSLCFNILLK